MAKYGNFETELERVNKQLNVYYATYMCKKGLFLPHTSDGNAVFVFLVHFPRGPKFGGNFLIKLDFFRSGPVFNFTCWVPDATKTWFLQVV